MAESLNIKESYAHIYNKCLYAIYVCILGRSAITGDKRVKLEHNAL